MKLLWFLSLAFFATSGIAQSMGFMTLHYEQAVPSSPSGSKNVMAVWITDASGSFIKTRMRFWGNGTKDHLPDWKAGSGQNVVDAITGATLTSSSNPTAFGYKTVIWDGKDVNGNLVPDGSYKVWIESSWQGNLAYGTHNELIHFTFTKGATADHQTPAGDNYITHVSLDWVPSATALPPVSAQSNFSIYPNPVKHFLHLNYHLTQAADATMLIYDIKGRELKSFTLQARAKQAKLDLSFLQNGVYFYRIRYQGKDFKTGKFFKS